MKKRFFLPIFISFFSITFSFHLEEYKLFNEAQTYNSNQEYEKASFKFKTLEKTLPNSPLVKENYYNFFNSLNFYKMNELDKAIFQMEKAVYTPKYLKGTNLFKKERDFYLANFYLEQGNKELSKLYFLRVLENGFSFLEKNREKIVLENLKNTDIKHDSLYEIIYEKSFSKIPFLDENSLVEVAQYLFDSNRSESAEKVLTLGFNKTKKSLILNRLFLKVLFENKNYKKLLDISEEIIKIEPRVSYFYYRGKTFKKIKNYPLAIFNLDKVHLQNFFTEQNIFEDEAASALLNILFALEQYPELLETVNKKNSYSSLGKKEQFLVILSYFKIFDFENGISFAKEFITQSPFNYEANYLKVFLKNIYLPNGKLSKEKMDLFFNTHSLALTEMIFDEFLKKLTPVDEVQVKNEQKKKIYDISKLGNPDFLSLELESENYPNYFISQIYADNGFYYLAYLNAKNNMNYFGKHKNFITYLYPKYYSQLVEKNAEIFSLPVEIIYTVILLSSEFNEKNISKDNKIGVMGVSPLNSEDFSTLFSPELNIQSGTEILSKIYKDNKNYPLPTIVEYLYGEEIRKSIVFEDGDVDILKITDTSLRKNILSIIQTYLFYKKIYEKI